MKYKKIAVIKFSAFGDIAAINPFIKVLSKKFHVTLVTSQVGHQYYRDIYNLDFIVLKNKKNIFELLTIAFNLYKFDTIIDLQGNDRSKFITLFSRSKTKSNYVNNYRVKENNSDYIKTNSILHLDSYSILSEFITNNDLKQVFMKERLNHKYIIINCGSSEQWKSKRLPNTVWVRIAKELDKKFHMPLYFIGDKSEVNYINNIFNNIHLEKKNFVGKTNIQELKKLVSRAYLTVTTDSAAMHISASQGVPTIGVFGPTNWIKSSPFGPWSTVVYDKVYFKDGNPLEQNSKKIDNYFDHIDISEALNKLSKYLK